MTVEQLKERISKLEQNISKKEILIEKRIKSIAKKEEEIKKLGFEVFTTDELIKLRGQGKPNWNEAYWLACDLEGYHDSIKSSKNEIEENKNTITKYKNMLEVEIQKQNSLDNMPEIFKEVQEFLINTWDKFDINRRDNLRKVYKELSYSEFMKKHNYSSYELMQLTDEQIHNINVKDSKNIILDLLNRVGEITGEVTSYAGLHVRRDNSGYAILNGMVEGKQGTAEVESIYAGGYNIQRLHIRVLVKKVNR